MTAKADSVSTVINGNRKPRKEPEPMTLWDLEQAIKQARALGAEDYDPVYVNLPVRVFEQGLDAWGNRKEELVEEFHEQWNPAQLRLEKHGRRELWLR